MNKIFHVFIKRLFLFIPALIAFSSCSTDFDPNAEYKEIPVIYTILDPTESTHYVKVNKAFLNNGTNALTIAANNPDSTSYQDSIVVELLKVRNDRDSLIMQSYTLQKTIIANKDSGDFYYPEQVLYKIENVQLDHNFLYRVRVTNTRTGLVAYGTTSIVDPFCVTRVGNAPFPCTDSANLQEYKPEMPTAVRYYTSQEAGVYKVTAYFTFQETLNGNTETKTIRWDVTSNELRRYNSQTYEQIIVEKFGLLRQLMTQLKPEDDPEGLKRSGGLLRFVVTAGSEELATYYLVNNSFSVFSQTIPEYDNVVNGTGLVASRRKVIIDNYISEKSKDSVSRFFPELKFQ